LKTETKIGKMIHISS